MEVKRINFGKYKGSFVKDIAIEDKGYLEWLLREKQKDASNGNVDEDWIFTLKKYI
jgi:uncharacterized protein (DUF3820 family)